MSGEKQIAAESGQVGIGTAPPDKCRTGDTQAVMFNRVEHPQAGVGTVTRHQHHLDPRPTQAGIQAQELLHQWKSIAWLKYLVLVLDLIVPIGLDTLGQIDLVAFAQVEQSTRRDCHHQFAIQSLCHTAPPSGH